MTSWAKGGKLASLAFGSALAIAASVGAASAAQPKPWEMTFQPAATDVMASVTWFGNYTLVIMILIVALVLALLLYCAVRFSSRSNPQPSKTSHNTLIEVVWTVLPVLILVAIAVPSFRLLFFQLDIPEADLTVKATGYQWYWGYTYPDEQYDGIDFSSYILQGDDLSDFRQKHNLSPEQAPRLLTVDADMVVPVNKVIRMQVTSADVIHSFAMPSFGIKIDAIPGRLNETWFKAEKTGTYYGQCSELCGQNHAFMPIAIRVVEEDQFEQWASAAKDDIQKANDMLFAWQAEERERQIAAVEGDGASPKDVKAE
ncbi:cytochrome c oxidase subunit II [Amorphus sp. 3PC139-8]|uniref:cytochrome c oxidase subunit II n=1 Tax=Amorphus sp. 3PC139-8 TaxID=2735676 RepID=UPI00345DD2E5